MKKVTPAEYTIFCEKYYSDLVKRYPSYRFGQAFFNEFLSGSNVIEYDNLFNQTDTIKAQDTIWKYYIYTDTDYAADLKHYDFGPTIGSEEIDKQFVKALRELDELCQ